MVTSTHQTLIQRVQDPSNENAWSLFTETYSSYIDEMLKKTGIFIEEVTDLRQDILLKLWKKLPDFKYDPQKTKFRTWLYQVIRNTAYNHASSKESEQKRVQRYFLDNSDGKDALHDLLEDEWQEFICHKALNNLSGSASLTTSIESTRREDIDEGISGDYANYIGICVSFSAAISMEAFGFIDLDGDVSEGQNEWVGSFGTLAGDDTGGANGDNRSGVTGFIIDETVVIPDPSATALFGLGGLALLARRRRK